MTTKSATDHPLTPAVTIRRAGAADAAALVRLAALDSRRPLTGACLVAEVDGELRAAYDLDAGRVAADPFHRTDGLVALLRERAAHLQAPAGRARTSSRGRSVLAALLRPRPLP